MNADCKQQLWDCCRLGFRDQFGEPLDISWEDLEKAAENWDYINIHEGYFSSVGLKRFYIKDKEIKTDKWSIPYRGFMMPVAERDCTVVQCISGDFVIVRVFSTPEILEEVRSMIRPDSILDLGMSYEEFKLENKRELSYHKKIATQVAVFNESPERFDKNGEVITSLDHFDNYEYRVQEHEDEIYRIYDREKKIRSLERQIMWMEEQEMTHRYMMDDKYIMRAVDVICRLHPHEIEKYFMQTGDIVFKKKKEICFECELTQSEMWMAWRYLRQTTLEEEIAMLEERIKDLRGELIEEEDE